MSIIQREADGQGGGGSEETAALWQMLSQERELRGSRVCTSFAMLDAGEGVDQAAVRSSDGSTWVGDLVALGGRPGSA